MRVLFQLDQPMYDIPGGHRRQLEKTLEAVRAEGVDAAFSADESARLDGWDVVHIFSMRRSFYENARQQGVPIALSPIYWSQSYTLNTHRMEGRWHAVKVECKQRFRAAWNVLRHGTPGVRAAAWFMEKQAATAGLFQMADVVLPNAQAEADDLVNECGVLRERIVVVPNAIDTAGGAASPEPFVKTHGVKDFVLCVGRVEPRKNQLRLIQAARKAGLPLVIVDPVHPHHAAYRERCRRAMGNDVVYMQKLPDDMLRSAYAAARVHALPSFFETTGLVSLEAGLAGCRLVVNDQPHTREYFLDHAQYCDPYSVASIAAALKRAFDGPAPAGLREHILSHYTWTHTARATIAAYETIVRSPRRAEKPALPKLADAETSREVA